MRTSRIVAQACVVAAVLCAAPLDLRGQQSVADGFPSDILSPVLTLTGTTDLSYGELASGDVNEDGLPDVVAFDLIDFELGPYSIALYLGTPGGDLSVPILLPVPPLFFLQMPVPRLADVNADGHLDVLGIYRTGATVAALIGDGAGSFDPYVLSGGSATGTMPFFDIGDLDGDGFPDVVYSDGSFFSNYRIVWQRGHGDGTFDTIQKILPARSPTAIVARDFNADGRTDLAFLDGKSYEETVIVVHLGVGGGLFSDGVAYPLGPDGWGALETADANGDGNLDIYNTTPVGGIGNGGVRLLLGDGDGAFAPASFIAFGGITPASFKPVDVDRDGVPDLVGAQSSKFKLQRMSLGGPIGPAASVTIAGSGNIFDVEVADLDADGLSDLVGLRGTQAFRVLNLLEGFIDLGFGQSSGVGTPVLTVSGTPSAGGAITAGIDLPSAVPGLIFIGGSSKFQPFHGGVLVPAPDLALPILAGTTVLTQWPTTIPTGTAIHVQAVLSLGGGQTLNSNALVMIAE